LPYLQRIKSLEEEAVVAIQLATDLAAIEALRVQYLGRKAELSAILKDLKSVSPEERPAVGAGVNQLKNKIQKLLQEKAVGLKKDSIIQKLDLTLPGTWPKLGHQHPLTRTISQISAIFEKLGFHIAEGPEIETEFNNFTALNIPLEHPSRDSFDTFYIKDDKLLRSQTSTVQIQVMQKIKPPMAILAPGKVFRPDAVDASHSFMFHQIEGFLVDTHVSFSDLKGVLKLFVEEFFGAKVKMRFRPHFFPFTEPSAEVDISCIICNGKGCSVCKQSGWLEVLGCGMIHPNVFKAVGYPKGKWTGYAFGMGVERIAMLKYGIDDIRLFFENDLRFLEQF